MPPRASSPPANQIVPAPGRALASRSAALVARGLLDLARDSNWLIKKIFTGHTRQISVSTTGQLSVALPVLGEETEGVFLYDIELGRPTLALSVPGERPRSGCGLPAAFAWSATASELVAAWHGWGDQLYIFDLHGKIPVGSFGEFSDPPGHLAWSESGRYFASSSKGGVAARVRLWEAAPNSTSGSRFKGAALREVSGPRSFEQWLGGAPLDAESSDESAFAGFGRIAFSPNESTLASVVEVEGEWADDSIVLLDVPTLRQLGTFQAPGHVTGLAWTFDSRHLILCSAGQAYRVSLLSQEIESLPFGGELVACHPYLPVGLCFSSWLRSSAKGRLFLTNLDELSVLDEYAADGVVDLRWSRDGSKAYAATADGLSYIYEPPMGIVATITAP